MRSEGMCAPTAEAIDMSLRNWLPASSTVWFRVLTSAAPTSTCQDGLLPEEIDVTACRNLAGLVSCWQQSRCAHTVARSPQFRVPAGLDFA
jgi:hypothetical protein